MNKEEAKIETQNQIPNLNANPNNQNQNPNLNSKPNNQKQFPGPKAKSCIGCLYYSSALRSKSRNPTCVGVPKTIGEVPRSMIVKCALEGIQEGSTVRDFKYVCVGSSVYLDNEDPTGHKSKSDKLALLPLCTGFKVLRHHVVPDNIDKNKDNPALPQPRTHWSTPLTGKEFYNKQAPDNEFYNRFKKDAGIVATAVVKNINKMGNRIKETLDDIMNRRPK